MTTLEELEYYCNELEPVGALMLTGEWGCGKTYLLEHSLKNQLRQTHIVLRISLFGLSSIEAIDESINSAWMNAYLEDKGWNDKSETLSKLKEKLSRLPLPENVKNVASFNPAMLLNVENELNGKKVVLVFDDLERNKLDTIDVLGCINDYCENKRFHTIVVANENKMYENEIETAAVDSSKENSDGKNQPVNIILDCKNQRSTAEGISYEEIKEKIIERTIKYKPDYKGIVHAVIDDQARLSEDYHELLVKHEDNVLRLFALSSTEPLDETEDIFSESKEIVNRSHNIRSLKCALQDFYRIYNILIEHGFSDLDKWLYSFMSYMLAYKAGKAKEGKYGTLFADTLVHKLYPAFNNRYIFETIKDWILKGEWDEGRLNAEIDELKERATAAAPNDVVRTNRILDIEDDILKQGFPAVLEMAYNGYLSLDEYINFIYNSYWAREYHFDLFNDVDWEKVKCGIQTCMDQMVAEGVEASRSGSYIDTKNRERFLPEEWKCYELIESFRNRNVLIFSTNRKLYLDSICESPASAFLKCERKRMNVFDDEMAKATAAAFYRCSNTDKNRFGSDFKNMWQCYEKWPDIRMEDTIQGFKKLQELLEQNKESLQEQRKPIAVGHASRFIEVMKELLLEPMQK